MGIGLTHHDGYSPCQSRSGCEWVTKSGYGISEQPYLLHSYTKLTQERETLASERDPFSFFLTQERKVLHQKTEGEKGSRPWRQLCSLVEKATILESLVGWNKADSTFERGFAIYYKRQERIHLGAQFCTETQRGNIFRNGNDFILVSS